MPSTARRDMPGFRVHRPALEIRRHPGRDRSVFAALQAIIAPRISGAASRLATLDARKASRGFRMQGLMLLLMLVAVLLPRATSAAAPVDVQALKGLAERYWAAEVRQDYNAVYDMLSPGERNAKTRSEYVDLRKHVGPFRFLAAKTGRIDVAGKLAWVHVNFEWSLPKYPSVSRTGETWHLWRHEDGWFPIPLGERDMWPLLPPHLRAAEEEAALGERVKGLWRAKAAEHWEGVYGYMPPDWRARVPLSEFLKSKARFLYFSPTVEWVEVKGAQARASIAFEAKLNDPAVTKAKPKPEKVIEPWVKIDESWYLDLSVLEQPQAKSPGPATSLP
jgi:hypothetical protein